MLGEFLVSISCVCVWSPAGSRGHLPSGAKGCGIPYMYAPPCHRRYSYIFYRSSNSTSLTPPLPLSLSLYIYLFFCPSNTFCKSGTGYGLILEQQENYNHPATLTAQCVQYACVFVRPDSHINERIKTLVCLLLLFPWRLAQAV